MITQRKRKKKFLFFLSFGCATQHVASYFSDQELNSCPSHWKFEVSATGLPGKSLKMIFFFFYFGVVLSHKCNPISWYLIVRSMAGTCIPAL